MPRNGTGTFNPPGSTWNPPVNGVTATATDWSTLLSDLSTALTQSVSSDGQTTFTGNLPMGGNKITGLAAGTAASDAAILSQTSANFGQCRLSLSGANLLLSPYNGNRITINGVVYTIPSSGVTLSTSGAAASTVYFIYAYVSGGAVTLEFSTTGHATDTTTGVEIKSGDASRTLVGMARTSGATAWTDSLTNRYIVNWFNRRPILLSATLGSDTTSTSTSSAELSSSVRNSFLTWADSPAVCNVEARQSNNTAGQYTNTQANFDGSASSVISVVYSSAAASQGNGSSSYSALLSEGFHYSTLFASVSANTGTWYSGAQVQTIIQG